MASNSNRSNDAYNPWKPTVVREVIFATAPVLSNNVPVRISHATLREVITADGVTRFQIENRSGEKLFLDRDSLAGLALALRDFIPLG